MTMEILNYICAIGLSVAVIYEWSEIRALRAENAKLSRLLHHAIKSHCEDIKKDREAGE